ncbi:MAG TPA: hypothetical protein VGD62_00730 [Acidobacteriaceae bacterium]
MSAIRPSLLALFCSAAAIVSAQPTFAASLPTAAPGYAVSVFAAGVAGSYSAPDSIAVYDEHIFIGYGDGNLPDGSDGKSTQVVQYSMSGAVEWVYNVKGHQDGLKVDPYEHFVWALQNEDANPNAVAINYKTHTQSAPFTFAAPTPHGGGYDDIVFRAGKVYLSASNPANNPNTKPAIVQATIGSGNTINVTPVLMGNAQATNVVTGATVTLNLQDPDSMTLDPSGDLFMTSQGDGEIVIVRKPGSTEQSVLLVPLTSPWGTPMVDDTVFTPAEDGYILVADKDADTVYAIRKTVFAPGSAYSAAQATEGSNTVGFVGKLDVEYGLLTPVITNMSNPGGMAFVRTNQDDSALEEVLDFCNAISAFTGNPLN